MPVIKIARCIIRKAGISTSALIGIAAIFMICCVYFIPQIDREQPSITVVLPNHTAPCQTDEINELPISIPSGVQSTWTCSGNMNYEYGWHRRTCAFKNICYDKRKQVFQFYRAPGSVKQPILFEPKQGHIYEFNMNNHGFVGLVARAHDTESWGPTIVEQLLPSANDVPYLENVHVLFQHWHVSYNPGHVIWEDIASTYFAMARLDEYDLDAVLLEYKHFPRSGTPLDQMYKNLVPAFAASVNDLKDYMNNFPSSTICFRTVVAGGAMTMFSIDNEKFTNGKERLLYEYRTAILQYHGVNIFRPPTKHRIVLVNKTIAWRRSLRAIKNINEVEKFIRTTYPDIQLDVVVWHDMSFTKQMQELYKTTILITPCGGVSSTVPFLPKGAHAIIMDFFVNKEAYLPHEYYQVGESGSMDAAIWNYFPHIRKLYYQVRSEDDFVFDFPNAANTRHDASIIVKMPRLKELIDTAIENSGNGPT